MADSFGNNGGCAACVVEDAIGKCPRIIEKDLWRYVVPKMKLGQFFPSVCFLLEAERPINILASHA